MAGERSRIDALLAGTTIDLNQLQELVTAYTTSDASILAQIALLVLHMLKHANSLLTISKVLTGKKF